MVDSDDSQMELTGDMRGGEMAQAEWEVYEGSGTWAKARARYENNDDERKKEKRAIFDEVADGEPIGEWFWEDQSQWETYWGDLAGDAKDPVWAVIRNFHGDRFEKALEALKEKQ